MTNEVANIIVVVKIMNKKKMKMIEKIDIIVKKKQMMMMKMIKIKKVDIIEFLSRSFRKILRQKFLDRNC